MLNGPSRPLRAYLLLERVMMEADGAEDPFGEALAEDGPLAWLWAQLSPEEKAWCQARTPEQIDASFAMPIGTPGFYDLTAKQSIADLLAQHRLDPSEVHAEVGKLLDRKGQ